MSRSLSKFQDQVPYIWITLFDPEVLDQPESAKLAQRPEPAQNTVYLDVSAAFDGSL